jgi:hypothetical protein
VIAAVHVKRVRVQQFERQQSQHTLDRILHRTHAHTHPTTNTARHTLAWLAAMLWCEVRSRTYVAAIDEVTVKDVHIAVGRQTYAQPGGW